MSSSDNSFKHVSLQDGDSIIAYLEALGGGFKQGALLFSTDNKRLVLKPQGLIKLEVEAKRKDEQMKLTLKFRWNEEVSDEGDLSVRPIAIGPA
jgi:amphi-Trp domain-containing protein